jgi:hypothetical protein
LKPENVHQRRSVNNRPRPLKAWRRNNYVRSLELELERLLTTGTFNLNCQRSAQIRTGRLLSDITAGDTNACDRRPRNLTNIPRDFSRCQPFATGAPRLNALFSPQRQTPRTLSGSFFRTRNSGSPFSVMNSGANARHAAPVRLLTRNQRAKAPEHSNSLKNSIWRFRDSR